MNKTERITKSFSASELLAELRRRESLEPSKVKAMSRAATKAGERGLESFSSAELAKALHASQKVVYGIDDRKDYYEIEDESIKRSASGVASLIDMSDIVDNGDGTSTIRTVSFKDAFQLCDGEKFGGQPTSPFCSGFLVGTTLLATAGHCINNNNLARTRFVFGFVMNDKDTASTVIPNSDIYTATSIVAHRLKNPGPDYAVVKLSREVTGRKILPLRRTGKIEDGRKVYVIGHPSGLPLKYASGAEVRENDQSAVFVANLDTYGGNSGSPVFDELSGQIEGILVRGETDFVTSGTCRVTNVCPTTGCRGEDVTRATEFADHIPEIDQEPDVAFEELQQRVDQLKETVASLAKSVKRIERKLDS